MSPLSKLTNRETSVSTFTKLAGRHFLVVIAPQTAAKISLPFKGPAEAWTAASNLHTALVEKTATLVKIPRAQERW
jgi:hypothetical protein